MRRVSFFIPHVGCPLQCSFCNQNSISGTQAPPRLEQVEHDLEIATQQLGDKVRETQIAFFGGSFTAIPLSYRKGLLDIAGRYCHQYGYEGIRFSTRPDAITPAILQSLAPYPIVQIELGAQSMRDDVLLANNRGHSVEQTYKAVRLVKETGYGLTLQMMTGLFGDTPEGAVYTAQALAECEPQEVRIYPTLVLEDTPLAMLYREGKYTPWTLEKSILNSAQLLRFFREKEIAVIRLGLHEDQGLQGEILAGPHHPAYGELCEGAIFYQNILQKFQEAGCNEGSVEVSSRDISKVKGHGGWLIKQLAEDGIFIQVKTNPQLSVGNLKIECIGKGDCLCV